MAVDKIANKTDSLDILHAQKEGYVDTKLFNSEAENMLYEYVQKISNNKVLSCRAIYELLLNFVPVVDKFFEDVMVMDKNILIKNNRLRLLEEANKEFLTVADFTKIVK